MIRHEGTPVTARRLEAVGFDVKVFGSVTGVAKQHANLAHRDCQGQSNGHLSTPNNMALLKECATTGHPASYKHCTPNGVREMTLWGIRRYHFAIRSLGCRSQSQPKLNPKLF
jgi:hypothetical protein